MLIRFRVSNFRSLRDEAELSMVASSFEDESDSLVPCEALGCSLLRAAALYGANAAGKSNVLAAMEFMSRAVRDSHRAWRPDGGIPRQPFLLDPERAGEPSLFEVELLLDGVRYRYGFRIDSDRILGEWLHAFPNRRPQLWFSRDVESQPVFTFGKSLKGKHRAIEPLTRRNSLFLSAAAENNHPALSAVYSWLATRFALPGTSNRQTFREVALSLLHDGGNRSRLLRLLQDADLGILDWTVRERERDNRSIQDLMEQLRAEIRQGHPLPREDDGGDSAEFAIELEHRANGSKGVLLPFHEESLGTQAWFAIAGLTVAALNAGAVLTLDELDTSLHPHLALQVIRIFQDPVRNPRNAQLLFNTHDTNLLRSLLRRDQIWFVEKDSEGASHLYPLTDFKPRKGENLERGYLQGRYGAIPYLGDLSFIPDAP